MYFRILGPMEVCGPDGQGEIAAPRQRIVLATLLLALLFFTGYRWAKYTLGHPWVVGLCFLVGGIAMVWTAIMLGG